MPRVYPQLEASSPAGHPVGGTFFVSYGEVAPSPNENSPLAALVSVVTAMPQYRMDEADTYRAFGFSDRSLDEGGRIDSIPLACRCVCLRYQTAISTRPEEIPSLSSGPKRPMKSSIRSRALVNELPTQDTSVGARQRTVRRVVVSAGLEASHTDATASGR